MAIAYSAVRSESPAERPEVRSAEETAGARSVAYDDPASVPEDVQERLLYQSGDTNKGPTKRAGCAECKVVFSTDRAFDAHVQADGHIDPADAGLVWNPRGYFTFAASTMDDTNVVNMQSISTRAQQPSGGSGKNRRVAVLRTRLRSSVPPLGPAECRAKDSRSGPVRPPTNAQELWFLGVHWARGPVPKL